MMTTKAESRLHRRIKHRLENEFGAWFFKVHGSPFQPAGIPDLVGTVKGLFFALEVKMPNGTISKVQETQIKLINKAGGYATVVESVEEAVDFVRKTIKTPKKSRRSLPK